jgi:hypothetical protein
MLYHVRMTIQWTIINRIEPDRDLERMLWLLDAERPPFTGHDLPG